MQAWGCRQHLFFDHTRLSRLVRFAKLRGGAQNLARVLSSGMQNKQVDSSSIDLAELLDTRKHGA